MDRSDAKTLAAAIEREFLAGTDIESRGSHSVLVVTFTHRRKKQVKQTHKALKSYLTDHGYDDVEMNLRKQGGQLKSTFVIRG